MYILLCFLASLVGLTTWLTMLAKHKYNNYFTLIGVGMGVYFSISRMIHHHDVYPWGILLAFLIYCSGFLIEEYHLLSLINISVRDLKDLQKYEYKDMEKEELGNFYAKGADGVTNRLSYKNGRHLTVVSKYQKDTTVGSYYTDYDIVATVHYGQLEIKKSGSSTILKKGDTMKMYSYCPFIVTGKAHTVVHLTCLKPD